MRGRMGLAGGMCALALVTSMAHAQDTAELAKQLSNPVAALISVPFQSNFDRDIGPADEGERYTLNFQPVIPFTLNEQWNLISRTIVPWIDQDDVFPGSGSQSGLGDTVQSVFLSPVNPTSGGWIWGAGPVLLFPTASEDLLGSEQWGLGPTAVALRQAGPWTVGGLANHLWSVAGDDDRADLNATFLQPFVSYTTPTAWTFTAQMEATYDWESEQWNAPAGLLVAKVTQIGGTLVQFQGGPRYYVESTDAGPEGWGLRFNVILLFPR